MLISWDTEHKPGTDYAPLQPLTCVSFCWEDGRAGLLHARDPKARELVATALTHHTSVGANIAHDVAEAIYEWPELAPLAWQAYEDGRIRDLIQCERLIAIEAGDYLPACAKNLEELALKYGFGQLDKDDDIRMTYGPLRDVPLDQWSERHRKYPVEDARSGMHVAIRQPLKTYWEQVAREDFCCVLMSAWGFRTDLARVARLKRYCEQKLATAIATLTRGEPLRKLKPGELVAIEELLRSPILRPNPKNRTGYSKIEKVIEARMIVSGATRQTKGGGISCDAEALEASNDPMLMALVDYNSFQKRLGACEILGRGELHCWFKPMQENNQTSCGAPYNAQNPPTDGGERECIIPRPGFGFIDADVNLFHLRAFSQVCLEIVGRSDMADVLLAFDRGEGPNVHVVTGSTLAGVPIDQFQKKGAHEKLYGMAKRYNFSLLADAGYARVAASCSKDGVKLDERDFYAAKNAWKFRYPEAQMYFDYIQSLGDGATITELFTGRRRGGCSFPDAANGFFSGLANSALKATWFRLARECYDPTRGSILLGSRPVNIIHDQFLIETLLDEGAHERTVYTKVLMEEELRKLIPDVPPTTDPCLCDRWSKKAEAVFDKNGRHVLWRDEEKEAA